MPVFTTPPAPQAAPIPKSRLIAGFLPATVGNARANYVTLCQMQKATMKSVWDNPAGLTPKEAVAALGKNARLLFEGHAALTALIVQLNTLDRLAAADPLTVPAPDITLPTHAWTVNADGSITVLDEPYNPQG